MANDGSGEGAPGVAGLSGAVLAGDSARLRALLASGGDANAVHRCVWPLNEKLGLSTHYDTVAPLLVLAAGLGHADMVAALLEHGARVDQRAHYWTYVVVSANEESKYLAADALTVAARKGDIEIVRLLLEAEARLEPEELRAAPDPDLVGSWDEEDGEWVFHYRGATPLAAASRAKHQEVVDLLKAHGHVA